MPRYLLGSWMLAALAALAYGLPVRAQDPAAAAAPPPATLHERIDQLLAQEAVGPVAALCSDADFVRRVWLDVAGMIPPAEEVRAFLADATPDKRAKLIDRLLASPQFNRHMTLLLDATITERRPDKGVTDADWQGYLYKSLAENKSLDQLLKEVIAADGADAAMRPAAKFLLDRDCEPNVVTRDLGRLVFGMDLQCAQCHDHPLVDDYLQADYYGLYAFVMRSSVFVDKKNKDARLIGETADGEASFKSVFTGNTGDKVQPRLPKSFPIFEPLAKKGEEYIAAPGKEARGVPKFSRRVQLADKFEGSIPFRRNLANRLWAQVMGRGLVHPVDAHHPGNPPAHPALLTLLADELPKFKYDLRSFLREILLSNAYQRSCELVAPAGQDLASFDQQLAALAQQQAVLAQVKDTKLAAWKGASTGLEAVRKQLAESAKVLDPLKASLAAADAEATKAQAAAAAAQADVEAKKTQTQVVQTAAVKAKEAADLLKEDKELADAAAKIAARAAATAEAEKVATAKAAELAAVVGPTKNKLIEAQAAVDTASGAIPPPAKLLELETAERTSLATFNDAQYAVADLEARTALVKQLKQHAEALAKDAAEAGRLWQPLLENLANRGQVAQLKPLSAEQFALSTMQAAGVLATQEKAAEDALTKANPDEWAKASDADKPQVMRKLREPKVFENVRGQVGQFVQLYGGLPGQDFQATVNQALFFGNGSVLDSWLKPGSGLLAQLTAKTEPAALADELYFGVLGRAPSADEITAVGEFLKDRTEDRPVALAELTWALLASSEFRFNH